MHKLKQTLKSPLLLMLCLAIATTSFSQNNPKSLKTISGKSITIAKLDSKIKSIVDSVKVPGLSIAIINNSKIVYHNTFGVTNTETKNSVDAQTIFEAASLSKPIFAYFVMKMVEKGKLDLDKPLYEYLPHLHIKESSQKAYKLITARMVLSHRSGFPNHANGAKIELAFTPGTGFMYSGEGYEYLAKVVGKINNMGIKADLNELFQKEVTEPLKMPHSTFVLDAYIAEHKANGHDENGKPTENAYDSGDTLHAGASLHSEAFEYAKFVTALLKREGLKPETFDEMLKEHTHFKDDNHLKQEIGQSGWGLGLTQKPTEYGMMHMHTGNNHDFQAYMMMLPDMEFGIIFFMNAGKAIPFIQQLNNIIGPIF